MLLVTLKPSHPTGVYRRAGMEFTRAAAVKIENPDADLLALLKADRWLVVSEVVQSAPADPPPPPPADPAGEAEEPRRGKGKAEADSKAKAEAEVKAKAPQPEPKP